MIQSLVVVVVVVAVTAVVAVVAVVPVVAVDLVILGPELLVVFLEEMSVSFEEIIRRSCGDGTMGQSPASDLGPEENLG